MQRKIAVFVGTRADLGPLIPVIEALEGSRAVELHLIVGVAYGRKDLDARLQDTFSPSPDIGRIHALASPMTAVDRHTMLEQGAALGAAMSMVCIDLEPEALIVLGDRWELLYVVPPAFLAGIRVVHLHGGEVTEGALDERVRHAVSKLSDQHCVASDDSARRLRQLGESSERIHVTGAPGLDLYNNVAGLTDSEFAELFGQELIRPLALFTYHPPTAETVDHAGEWARDALEGTLDHCNTVVVSHPGMDAGRDAVLAAINEAGGDSRVLLVESLGPNFARTLATADVVVGNSSSGVIEAASVGVPVVDIGMRQKGRLRGANVRHAEEGRPSVSFEVASALSESFRATSRDVSNPYGDGSAAQRILKVVLDALAVERTKAFNDCGTQ